MATEAKGRRVAPAASAAGIGTAAAARDSAIDLAHVERELRKLLHGYRFALQYASDMPWLGCSAVSVDPANPRQLRLVSRWRWGSRFWTRVYVETHVRKQLRAIGECIRLRLLDTEDADNSARLKALAEELEAHSAPLFRWNRFGVLVSRLPPVAAAIPVISAASAWPLEGDVELHALRNALLVLLATALVVWTVVVWPSLRLGFRVKRAILAGGRDLRRPFFNSRGPFFNSGDYVTWHGFAAPRYADGAQERAANPARTPFPSTNVYRSENDLYRALGRRKPTEAPLDLLLSFTPYAWTTYSVFFFYGLVNAIATHSLGDAPWGGLFIAGLLALFPIGVFEKARQTYRKRAH
jgi:hypothetical protein